MAFLTFLAGLALLIAGGEALVRGAARLAAAVGISPLIIGLTVVAFGTSSPELAVSIKSALWGQPDIAMGNVVGSNIFNILLILGVSALIAPLVVHQQLVRLDVPLMVVVSVLVLLFALDGKIDRVEGVVLFSGLVFYILFLLYLSRREESVVNAEYSEAYGSKEAQRNSPWLGNTGLVLGGLALLALGSRWLVDGATVIAAELGVSDLVIGLTIVAAGTSLPEVVTSVIASIRGERDIAVGNAVGSNLFNILCVLGLTSIIAPSGIGVSESVIRFDLPVMIAVAFACLPIFFTNGMIARWEGALLVAYYVAYTLYLILAATRHDALPVYGATMVYFVIPLTVLTLLLITVRAIRRGRIGSR
jgi:cation:H+ antiporter